ncbi:MAG: hypothetical protein M3Q07_26625 [Pseudobdellovibrionaceae bacterium]|nr:hypothetical protein [Pseudobdellovibrionaceae bacterium]
MTVLHEEARKLLAQAFKYEVEDYASMFPTLRDADRKLLMVRNGHMPEREIKTDICGISVKTPRGYDKRFDEGGRRIGKRNTKSNETLHLARDGSFKNGKMEFTSA